MKRMMTVSVLVLFVTCLGCAMFQPAAAKLLEPADATNPTGPTLLDQKIKQATDGTPYEKYASNAGAIAAVLLSFLAYQKAGKAEKATKPA